MGFFTKIKDKTSSYLAEKILKEKLERYGDMMELKIDSENNRISIRILLKGDSQAIDILINSYSFTKEGDDNYIVVDDVNISKEWMDLLAQDLLKDKKFKLPGGIASTVIKMVM